MEVDWSDVKKKRKKVILVYQECKKLMKHASGPCWRHAAFDEWL